MKRVFPAIILAILIPIIVLAATFTIDTSGNWSDTGSWSTGVLPGTGDDVDMNNGISITILDTESFEVVSISTSNNNVININDGGTLTITNPGADAFTAQNNETINVDGDLIIDGNLVINNNLIFNVGATGSVTITGDVTINNGATLDISGSVSVDGDFTGGNNTSVNVDGSLDVTGAIDTGNGSELTGSGTVTSSGCTGDPDFCNGAPLPITLIYFEAKPEQNQVRIHWASASEENFDYYTIEKSSDAIEFEELAKIEGEGDYQVEYQYSFIDEIPFSGINYYRLKSTDLDGTFKYHKIIGVNFNQKVEIGFLMYPNPTHNGFITIRHTSNDKTDIVSVYNLFGKQVYSQEVEPLAFTFRLPDNLTSGVYFVRLIQNGKVTEKRLVLAR